MSSDGSPYMEALNRLLAEPIWSVLSGALIGATVTWLAAWWYYRKAGNELREEASRLRLSTDLVLYCLTNKDAKVTANYDNSGHVSGLTVSAAGVAHISMHEWFQCWARASRSDPSCVRAAAALREDRLR